MSDTPDIQRPPFEEVDTEIRSALTEEEWDVVEYVERVPGGAYFSAYNYGGVVVVHCGDERHAETNRPQALAALCLHGQPFGFTWEDVDRLRAECYPPGRTPLFELMHLANRIAALLPPRDHCANTE